MHSHRPACSRCSRHTTPDVRQLHRVEHASPEPDAERSATAARTLARRAAALAFAFETFAARPGVRRRMRRESYVGFFSRWTRASAGAHLEGARNEHGRAVPLSFLKERNGSVVLKRKLGCHRARTVSAASIATMQHVTRCHRLDAWPQHEDDRRRDQAQYKEDSGCSDGHRYAKRHRGHDEQRKRCKPHLDHSRSSHICRHDIHLIAISEFRTSAGGRRSTSTSATTRRRA